MASALEAVIALHGVESQKIEAGRMSRLARVSIAALVPWLALTWISALTLRSPNMIVTPLMWLILLAIWSYPAVLLAASVSARVCQQHNQLRRATIWMSIPGAIGTFLFGMLAAPPALNPLFRDGYFLLMGSCLLSISLAGVATRWMLR